MRLVLLGPPGAGKGTQAQFLTARLHIPKISTGDMLRDAAEEGTAVGLEAKGFTDQGRLAPDEMILTLVRDRLKRPDTKDGYLLDGFPRTVHQAEAFREWLREQGQTLNAAVNIWVDDEVIVDRISKRRVCPQCHQTYHLTGRPPKVADVCDVCGSALVLRDDDRAEVVRERLRTYGERTKPVLDFYRESGMLIEIDGDQAVTVVTDAILTGLAARSKA